MCNSIMQLQEESSACPKTQTNSEHSSVLGVLCYYRFIIVIVIFPLSFDHKFIREYWCWIVVWLFLHISFDITDLCIGGSIIQFHSAMMDLADDCCPDDPKKQLQCSGNCSFHLFHITWGAYFDNIFIHYFDYWEHWWVATPEFKYSNIWLFHVRS